MNKNNKIKLVVSKWRLFFTPILGMLLALFLFFLFVLPKFGQIVITQGLVKERRDFYAKISEKWSDLSGIDKEGLQEEVSFATGFLPIKKDFLKILAEINSIAGESQVLIDDLEVSPGDVATGDAQVKAVKIQTVNFDLKVIGTSESVIDFLEKIEKALPPLQVISFKLNDLGTYSQAELKLESFFAPLSPIVRKTDTPLPRLTKEEAKFYEGLKDFNVYYPGSTIGADVPSFSGGAERVDPFNP